MALWLLPVLAVVAFGLTALVRRYALSRQLLDVPNARSSHVAPTPRGGGVSIVLCFLGSVPLLVGAGGLTAAWGWALAGAGGGVALVGFLDDHGHIPARWRLLAHFAAAFWALWLAAASMPLAVGGAWLGVGLSAFYLVWMLNLYNFMDGIDGIASVEAITVCAGAALIYWLRGDAPAVLMPPLALAAAVAGFLVWNFPPAKIFMGDAGSGFLGIVLGVLSLQAGAVSPALFWSWVILLGVFIVDATYTLLRRLLRGERVYEALAQTHPLLEGERYAGGKACFETFPHAVTCAMLGTEVAKAKKKRVQRRALLESAGVATASLKSIDAIDAAVCALTAEYVSRGQAKAYGDDEGGRIFVPQCLRRALASEA